MENRTKYEKGPETPFKAGIGIPIPKHAQPWHIWRTHPLHIRAKGRKRHPGTAISPASNKATQLGKSDHPIAFPEHPADLLGPTKEKREGPNAGLAGPAPEELDPTQGPEDHQ